MKVADSFALSLNSIAHRRLRSWLTLLGIIIGVAAVVAIISIGEGAQASVNQQLSSFGADIVTVTPGFSRAQGFGGSFRTDGGGGGGGGSFNTGAATSTEEEPTLTKKDAIIIGANPYVTVVTEIVSGRGEIVFLGEKASVNIQGVNAATWSETSNLTLASGRLLTSSDSIGVVIGSRIANDIFKQPITLGRTITLEDKPFTVVGILSSGSGTGQGDSTIYTTLNGAWNVLSEDVNRDTYTSIQAKVSDPTLVSQAVEELTATLQISRKVTERNQNFTVTSSQAIQEQVSSITGTLTLFLGGIAAISLIVGALGVANSMFTSVLEKTKEIGILKALGSTNNEILTLFVMESGLFGFVGGIIGVVLGTIASIAVSGTGIISIPGARGGATYVSIELVIIAIALSTIIGIISGLVPAINASRLRPIEALRYE